MALANFFGKNALAAAHVLNGMTPDSLAEILNDHVVGLRFDESVVTSFEGQTTLELAVNLAARLYPRMLIGPLTPTSHQGESFTRRLIDLALEINPDLELVEASDSMTVEVIVGVTTEQSTRKGNAVVIFAGSTGWTGRVSTQQPVGSGTSAVPFGAAAAACLALANVFRHVFRQHLPSPELDENAVLSLFDYRDDVGGANERGRAQPDSIAQDVCLGDTTLVGVGAIGNAVVWTLRRVSGLTGTLHLVDDQALDLTNLQRYVLATQAHLQPPVNKTGMAKAEFDRPNGSVATLQVVPHPICWAEFAGQRPDFKFERVATALDTVEARLDVQTALPARLLNAWTQQGDLGVSRHLSFGDEPCLACIYPSRPGGKSEAEVIAEAMVVPEPAFEIRELLHSGAPIDAAFIRGVAERRAITETDRVSLLLQYAGRPLREFYQEAFCGGLMLELGGFGDGRSIRAEAPIAFQSALAGVMLAAEIVIDAAGFTSAGRDRVPTRTVMDLLRPLSIYQGTMTRSTEGECICYDADYLTAYRAKYAGA